jgi:transposase InsO family protein
MSSAIVMASTARSSRPASSISGSNTSSLTPHSPWQNAYAERFIGSLRRECLDHILALDERQLLRVVGSYVAYYNRTRPHLALAKDAPETRPGQRCDAGTIVAVPEVGGLHHRYERRMAA